MVVINTNTAAQSSARLLANSSNALAQSLARLSSGSRLTSAADDPAGLAVSTRFTAQTSRIEAANSNVGNAISFSQTQDGFLEQVGSALDRLSELSVLAQDTTKTDSDRTLFNTEFATLGAFINDVATKDFNGVSLFNGVALSVTTDSDANKFSATGVNLGAALYTAATGSTVTTTTNAATALTNVKAAIAQFTTDRSNVGANLARLNSHSSTLSVLRDNLSAANSRIKDVDVAQESTRFARAQILVQSGTAILAQANALPQSALRLIG